MSAVLNRPHRPAHETLVAMLHAAACERPDGEALVHDTERLTYRDYWRCVAAFATELRALGAEGSRVAVLLPNGIDLCIASFAVQAAGGQLVPLNPLYTPHELRIILQDAEPVAVVYAADAQATIAPLHTGLSIANGIAIGTTRRLSAPAGSLDAALPELDPDTLAMLQYTGGTSGRPKGVDLTHRALAANVAQREALLPTNSGAERILAITPLYHAYATAMGLYLAANCSGTLVILPRYTPELALAAISEHRITLFAGSPAIFNGLVAHEATPRANLSSLRLCYSGAAALSADTLRRWEHLTGCAICEGYGMTEAGPVITFNPQDGTRKPGSAGIPAPLTDVQIVDIETGTKVLANNEPGEIRVRGPQIMSGYRMRPEETAAALRDGWLYTGDIGALDAGGYLFIRDRKKEIIIVSGFNVYPREVEEALLAHPGVLEAAVVGRPDDKRGEAVVAVVALRASGTMTADVLQTHLSDRLTRYKLPAEIHFISSLPKTAVGKIDKIALKQAAQERADLRPK